jgi:threonine 3-dehydrogenase
MAGRRHLCAFAKGIGVDRPGAFAEYIALPMTNVWDHDPSIDRDVAAIFDPFGNAVHTALQFPVLGEDVLITGAGPIGLMAAAVVRHAGARHVVITDVNAFRLELARSMGVTVALGVREGSLAETQAKLGMREGFDVGLEMSGNPAALHDMLANLSHGAKVAMLGLPDEPFAIDWNTVIFDQLTLKGVYGRQMYETWYMMTVMLQSGLDIAPVITHRFPAARFEEAFDAIRSGETGKVLLDWSDVA